MSVSTGHLHHKLVDKGISHRKAVLVLYFISGSLGIAGILVALNDILMAVGIIAFLLVCVGIIFQKQLGNLIAYGWVKIKNLFKKKSG